MRPSYTYFDKQDKRTKEEDVDKMDVEEDVVPTEPEAKQITVSFARTETDKIRKAREKSYGYLATKSAEEPWCDSVWWPVNSDESEVRLCTSLYIT